MAIEPFGIFETMLIQKRTPNSMGLHHSPLQFFKIPFLKEHIERMHRSFVFFQLPFSEKDFLNTVHLALHSFHPIQSFFQPLKLKIIYYPKEGWKYSLEPFLDPISSKKNLNTKAKVALSTQPISTKNIYQYHKTTYRSHYNTTYQKKGEYFDILFCNERKELVESCIHNLFLKINNVYYTPPMDSGCLPGILRNYVLRKFPKLFKEKILYPEDLNKAERIVLGNSVRGFREVHYLGDLFESSDSSDSL